MAVERVTAGTDVDEAVVRVRAVLACPTPHAWLEAAAANIETLLLDHASLELKAAQQAQSLIWRYGMTSAGAGPRLDDATRIGLVNRMSRLAREELRHYEQVVAMLEKRGWAYRAISASRYAAGLHGAVRRTEPGRLVDTLIVGALIEARSCERFDALVPVLEPREPELARFYRGLLRSESRHFGDYLELARAVPGSDADERTGPFQSIEAMLIESADDTFRFHSGVPC